MKRLILTSLISGFTKTNLIETVHLKIAIIFSFVLHTAALTIYSQDLPGKMNQALSLTEANYVSINKDAKLLQYDRMLFGQFIEHFHRQIYGGIFDPGSRLSDSAPMLVPEPWKK